MVRMILLGELEIAERGNTVIGMLRILARYRAYWIEKHQLPETTRPIAILSPEVVTAYGQPDVFLRAVGELEIEPSMGVV